MKNVFQTLALCAVICAISSCGETPKAQEAATSTMAVDSASSKMGAMADSASSKMGAAADSAKSKMGAAATAAGTKMSAAADSAKAKMMKKH